MSARHLSTDLAARIRRDEIMDQPGLDEGRHREALRALERINGLSLAGSRVWRRVEALFRRKGGPLRVLDVACGGGDIAVSLKRRADRVGLPLHVEGLDLSPVALAHGQEKAERLGLHVQFSSGDAKKGPLPPGFDLVFSSLFLHHLSSDEAAALLREMVRAGRSILVQDLLRTRTGYWLAVLAGTALTRSPVVRVDGPRSVRAAFSLPEVRQLTAEAGIPEARIRRCWPERFTIDWESA